MEQRKSELTARLEILPGTTHGEIAHALDHCDPLGDGDGTARIERVEEMRTLERPLVCGQHELRVETATGLCFVQIEEAPMQIDVRDFEVILREFVLVLLANRTVTESRTPLDVEHRCLARQKHCQSLDTVCQLR